MYIHSVPGFGLVPPAAGQGIREYDGVFEGGGAKGVAFVGALAFMKRHGLWFRRVAGTSAGAITAALMASGYQAYDDSSRDETIESITFGTNFLQFLDAPGRSHFTDDEIERSPYYALLSGLTMAGTAGLLLQPLASAARSVKINLIRETVLRLPQAAFALNLWTRGGLFAGDRFRDWMNDKISTRLRRLMPSSPPSASPTFRELHERSRISLSVIASDLGRKRMLIFNEYLTPTAAVADAVRMSMSLPFVFGMVPYQGCPIVDGGLLSNFPMFLFTRENPSLPNTPADLNRPTVGFLLDETPAETGVPASCPPNVLGMPIQALMHLAGTMMDAADRRVTGDFSRNTVRINITGFGPALTVQFGMDDAKKRALADRGWTATAGYFRTQIPNQAPSRYQPASARSAAAGAAVARPPAGVRARASR